MTRSLLLVVVSIIGGNGMDRLLREYLVTLRSQYDLTKKKTYFSKLTPLPTGRAVKVLGYGGCRDRTGDLSHAKRAFCH
jgi:hypothetical protein